MLALAAVFVLLKTANESFVNLDRLPFAAERASFFGEQFAHSFADTVGHEPRGAVAAKAEHPMKLQGTNALLAGGHQVRGQQPFVQRNVRLLVKRAHGGCERLLASAAFVQTGAGALALKFCSFAQDATVVAYGAIGPAKAFEMGAGGFFVSEDRVGQIASHGCIPCFWGTTYEMAHGMSSA